MSAMPTLRKNTGNLGEEIACRVLARRGYEIVERNWRTRMGEIDIVAKDGACWTFVEVKTRHAGGPELATHALHGKQAARQVLLAQIYLAERDLYNVDWRIDLAAIELDRRDQVVRFDLYPGVRIDP